MEISKKNFEFIKEGYASITNKKYNHAILILEKAVDIYRSNPYPLFLLSIAYLLDDKFDKADHVINKIKTDFPDYIPNIQLQAFLKMKSLNSIEEALSVYLDLVGKFPADPYFIVGIKQLKEVKDFQIFQKNAKLYEFVNIEKPPKSLKKEPVNTPIEIENGIDDKVVRRSVLTFKLATMGYLLIVFITAAAFLFKFGLVDRLFDKKPGTDARFKEVDMVELAGSAYDIMNKINKKKTAVFYYSVQQLTKDFNKSKKLIKMSKYNEAIILLNKINNSNISYRVKEKIDFLIKFVINSEDRIYQQIEYNKIIKEPHLHRGYALKWKGKVANLKINDNRSTFTLLVGYEGNDNFKGVSEIFLKKKNSIIKNGDMVEVSGLFISTIGTNNRIHIVAKTLKKL